MLAPTIALAASPRKKGTNLFKLEKNGVFGIRLKFTENLYLKSLSDPNFSSGALIRHNSLPVTFEDASMPVAIDKWGQMNLSRGIKMQLFYEHAFNFCLFLNLVAAVILATSVSKQSSHKEIILNGSFIFRNLDKYIRADRVKLVRITSYSAVVAWITLIALMLIKG